MSSAWSKIKKVFPEEGHLCRPGCGKCCQAGAYVEQREAEEIGRWICRHVQEAALRRQFAYYDTQPRMCPFLTPHQKCFIYPVRPVVCRMYGHLQDSPGMPEWCSQQCPEKVAFTLFGPDEYIDLVRPWFEATVKSYCRIGDFRKSTLIDKAGKKIVI